MSFKLRLQESGGNVVSGQVQAGTGQHSSRLISGGMNQRAREFAPGFVQVDHTAMEMSEQVDFNWGGPCAGASRLFAVVHGHGSEVRRSRNCLFRYSSLGSKLRGMSSVV